MARKMAPTPQAALPSVKTSARWNPRIIEKCLRGGRWVGAVVAILESFGRALRHLSACGVGWVWVALDFEPACFKNPWELDAHGERLCTPSTVAPPDFAFSTGECIVTAVRRFRQKKR